MFNVTTLGSKVTVLCHFFTHDIYIYVCVYMCVFLNTKLKQIARGNCCLARNHSHCRKMVYL